METIHLSIDQSIASIAFNRPEALNAFNADMARELAEVTTQLREQQSQLRAICLYGEGPAFMAGGDIRFFYKNLNQMASLVPEIMKDLKTMVDNLQQMDVPVLACVHGAVAGLGVSLMLACDLVIAADNTKITTAYAGIGLSPDGGMSYFLPRLVGTKKAMELFLMNDVLSASEAKTLGLVNWVASPESLKEEAQKILHQLSSGPAVAFAGIKSLVNHSINRDLDEQFVAEEKSFLRCTQTKDFAAGVSGFVEKKKPKFTGE